MSYAEDIKKLGNIPLLGEFMEMERMAKVYEDLAKECSQKKGRCGDEIKQRNLHGVYDNSIGKLYDVGRDKLISVRLQGGYLRVTLVSVDNP